MSIFHSILKKIKTFPGSGYKNEIGRDIDVSPYNNMLAYKKGYTSAFVKETIDKYKLAGLRIFDHLDPLDSIDFLKDYEFLKQLDVYCIHDQDYSFLKYLTNLTHLRIGISVKENNIINLGNQQKLESLNIKWRKGKIIGLENCHNIRSLTLESFKEKDFSSISHLKALVDVKVKAGSIETTNGLQNLGHLENLLLTHCPRLTSIKSITNLRMLTSLEIEACSKIQDYYELSGLDSLTSLKFVNCKGIQSLSFIKKFSLLKELALLGNTVIVDGDMVPAQNVAKVFHKHYKHYNIRIENKEYEQLIQRNLQKIKS